MREILFRGKQVDGCGWVRGSLVEAKDKETRIIPKHSDDRVAYCVFPVFPETVGQYTGLKDKNGVKIFERDILQDEDKCLGIVEFNKGRFVGNFDGRTYYSELYSDAEKSEIIGNIHDNPELLEEKRKDG